MPGILAGVQLNPNHRTKRPSSLQEGAKLLLSNAWRNRSTIMSAAQYLSPLLLAGEEKPADEEETIIKVNYLDTLQGACGALASLHAQNPHLDLTEFIKELNDERERVRKTPGRVVTPGQRKLTIEALEGQPQTSGRTSAKKR